MGRKPFPPLLGDMDGDGRADVFHVWLATGRQRTLVTVLRTSALGKPRFPAKATTGFGPRPLVFACGVFTNPDGRAEIAAVMNNGAVQIAYGFHDSATAPSEPTEETTAPPTAITPPAATNAPQGRPGRRRRAGAAATVPPATTPAGEGGDQDQEGREIEETPGGNELLTQTAIATTIPTPLRPVQPVRVLLPGDFDGDSRTDLLLVDAGGRLLFLRNETTVSPAGTKTADGAKLPTPRFSYHSVSGSLSGVQRFAAGILSATPEDRRSRLVYLDARGVLLRTVLRFEPSGGAPTLSPAVAVLREGETVSPTEPLAVGYFHARGASKEPAQRGPADILLGKRLLIGGDREKALVLSILPSASETKDDVTKAVAVVGDVHGNGCDDLMRVRRPESGLRVRERLLGDDGLIHFFFPPRQADDPVWTFVSTADDGLPDAWKLGKVKPGGYDLAALGCKVGRKSLIVEVQRVSDVPEETVRAFINEAVAYFASLPIVNPDGSRGISLHVIFREPIPAAESERTSRRYPPEIRKVVRSGLERKYHRLAIGLSEA
jgi:hypothetical protein